MHFFKISMDWIGYWLPCSKFGKYITCGVFFDNMYGSGARVKGIAALVRRKLICWLGEGEGDIGPSMTARN